MEHIRYAFEKGARIGLGSDSGAYRVPHGQGLLDEYNWMKEAVGPKQEMLLRERLAEAEAWIQKKMKQ